MNRGEIRLQIRRYHMMHHKDGSFFFLARVVHVYTCLGGFAQPDLGPPE